MESHKTMSVHSIIINPGNENLVAAEQTTIETQKDVQCYNSQRDNNLGTIGFYGRQYYALSKPSAELLAFSAGTLLEGTVGSICSSNYADVLSNIKNNIESNARVRKLRCDPIQISVYVTGQPENEIPFSLIGNDQIQWDESIGAHSRVTIQTECDNVH